MSSHHPNQLTVPGLPSAMAVCICRYDSAHDAVGLQGKGQWTLRVVLSPV